MHAWLLSAARGLSVVVFTLSPVAARAQVLAAANPVSPVEAAPAASAAVADPREWFGSQPWHQWTTVTGDWNTARSWLTEHGLAVAMAETADISSVPSGAGDRTAVARGLFDTTVAADATLLHVPGARALAQVRWLAGRNGSDVFGDMQGFSNVDADAMPVVGALWYEQQFGNRMRAKVGRVDANSEFAYVESASNFLSASMGFSPTIAAFPTYPYATSSVSVYAQPFAGVEVGGGVFNGNPEDGRWFGWDSRFDVVQVAGKWTSARTSRTGRISAGAWRLRGATDASENTSGVYVTAEQTVWSAAERSATVFAQFGASDAQSPVEQHAGAGVAVRGLTSRRPLDVTGVGMTRVRLAPEGTGSAEPSELALELFHRIVLTPSISVIPDVQFVDTRLADQPRRRATAMTCRVRLDF